MGAASTQPKVSVIFPIYNNEKYLENCIRSVMNQSLKDIELILIDDGSRDSAPAICDRLASEDLRITVVHKQNEGSAAGRNQGIDMASGEYVAFVESDDSVAPDMYEKLLKKAKETGADMVACNYHLTHEHSEAIGQVVRMHYNAQTGPLDEEKYKLLILDSGSLVIKIYKR